jgi:hypothetical protein
MIDKDLATMNHASENLEKLGATRHALQREEALGDGVMLRLWVEAASRHSSHLGGTRRMLKEA